MSGGSSKEEEEYCPLKDPEDELQATLKPHTIALLYPYIGSAGIWGN
jgi:hypothetical protein